jgi:hypothetical protein
MACIELADSTTATGPGGTIIEVDQGDVFLLRHTVTFDQPGETGYFIMVIYWYDDGSRAENFTLENAPSIYWENGPPVENVYYDSYRIPSGWQVEVGDNGSGIAGDGTFYVDIWLRAASGDGTPHRPVDNHPIYYPMDTIQLWEPDPVGVTAKPITIRVRELSAIIYPSDDADVYERYPDRNYGSDTSIWVCPYDNRKNRGFLKFNLSEIPSNANVQQAKLHLNCWKKEYDNFDAACCEVENDGWSENTITWNNQPSYGSSLDVVEIIGVGWCTWDVTSFVGQEFGGDNIVSFCLKGAVEPHGGRALFDSKEWHDKHPYLEVKYVLSSENSEQQNQTTRLERTEENSQLAFGSRSQTEEWPMFRHDLQHTGYTTAMGGANNYLLWDFQTGGAVISSPAVVNGKVYVGSGDNNVYCLNADNREKIWSYETGGVVWSSPAIAYGKVYICSMDGSIYCLDADTGENIWDNRIGVTTSSPAVVNGKVYVLSKRNLYCLNADDGNIIWRTSLTSNPENTVENSPPYSSFISGGY